MLFCNSARQGERKKEDEREGERERERDALRQLDQWERGMEKEEDKTDYQVKDSTHVKGALSRYSVHVFMWNFCSQKLRRGDIQGCGTGQRVACKGRSFFFKCGASKSIGVRVLVSCPCEAVPLLNEVGLWQLIKPEKWEQKDEAAQQWQVWTRVKKKNHGTKSGSQSSTDRSSSWVVLVRRSLKPRDVSGAVV